MKIDVVMYGKKTVRVLASVPGITMFKSMYSHWFREHGEIYIRQVGKKTVGSWRYIPNRSTDFYRCKKVTSQLFIEKLNKDFVNNIIKDFKE